MSLKHSRRVAANLVFTGFCWVATVVALTALTAILWALDNNANGTDNCNGLPGPAILRAYDATTLATLYSSDQQGGRDAAGDSSHPAIKFQPPVVANGHVYVAVSGQLVVYGLLP